jgi:hypothetical protein
MEEASPVEQGDGTLRTLVLVLVALSITAFGACRTGPGGADTRGGEATTDAATARPPGWQEGLRLDFDERRYRPGDELTRFRSSGTSWVRAQSVTTGSGEVLRSRGAANGWSVTLPAYSAIGGDYAVIRVSNLLAADGFSPGSSAFTVGADFALGEVSTGGSIDNGNNLVQRGLSGDSGQYKVEVDGRIPSCLVTGTDGTVMATASAPVVPESWYRVQCTRRDESVTLELGAISADGSATLSSVSSSGPIGEVVMPTHTPLSIGGKLRPDGTLVLSSTDQFNGKVDNVFYRLIE